MLFRLVIASLVTGALCSLGTATAAPGSNPNVAALQVALRAHGLYAGSVDGLAGPATKAAVQQLGGDRLLGTRTRAALGRFGRPHLGSRPIGAGTTGWDAAAVQFMLARHGFPSATLDGAFGSHSVRALEKFQRWAGLPIDGVAGPAVLTALRKAPPTVPIRLRAPVAIPYSDAFGPRGARFHTGLDYPAAAGAPVAAAAAGRVTWAGPLAGGWGVAVVIAHRSGVETLYTHLSRVSVTAGQRVAAGRTVGAVGATGQASGPHLHFEVRIREAAVDPRTGLQ